MNTEDIKSEKDAIEASSASNQEDSDKEKGVEGVSPSQEDSDKEKVSQPSKKDASTRIKTLAAQKNIAKEAYEKERELRIQAEAEVEKLKASEVKRPLLENFDTQEEYEAAYDQYLDKKTDAKIDAKIAQSASEDTMQELLGSWQPCLDRAGNLEAEKYPDLEEAFFSLNNTDPNHKYSDMLMEFIRTSPEGPKVLYHLYKTPGGVNKISDLPVAEQAQTLVRIQEEVAKEVREPSGIAPINPVGGSSTHSEDPEKMGVTDWLKWRESTKKIA